jgi:site-specific recombinase XerD
MSIDSTIFFQHVNSFIDYRKTIYQISDETIRSNIIDLRLFEEFVKDRHFDTITGPAVMAFQYYLKNDRLNTGPSLNRKIFTLKTYGRFLRLDQLENADQLPFRDVLKIRGGYKNRPDALTKGQVKTFFDTMDRTSFIGIRDYAVYALMYDLGLRVGEVHNLNLENLNLKAKKITVIGKGKRKRILPLNDEMVHLLSEWMAVRHNFLNSRHSQTLFISKKGNRLAIRTMEDNFIKVLKKSKLSLHFKATCHTLRHSFASHLNDNGTDVLVIQSLLGHSSPKSTDVYIHPSEQRIRQALEKLPGVLFMNKLIESGMLKLKFQSTYRPKRE